MKLVLLHMYFSNGINGELWYNDELVCYTIELPWKDNMRRISCIPEGEYLLEKRVSKRHGNHILVSGVEGRSLILIHLGNVATRDLKGCISPVMKLTGIGQGSHSRVAMKRVSELVYGALNTRAEVVLVVKERK